MKQRHRTILVTVPVAFPELVRVRVQVLDEDGQRIVQEREHTPLLPWPRIERLPMQAGVREQSERLLREGREAPIGTHLLTIDLNDCLSLDLEQVLSARHDRF